MNHFPCSGLLLEASISDLMNDALGETEQADRL